MLRRLPLLLTFVLTLLGCDTNSENHKEQPAAPAETTVLLQQPVKAVRFETATEALTLWRETAAAKPALLLASKNPQLQPIPDQISNRALATAQKASLEEIQRTGLATSVDPVILPNMALSAALDAGFFSKVFWVLPVSPGTKVTLEPFLKKLLELGDINQMEADSFHQEGNLFVGTIRGIPFIVSLLEQIPEISTPVILHFDIGFLGESYQNEIRTPLYQHTYKTLKHLSTLNLPTIAATISQSNLTGEVSLGARFLGPLIARLIKDPTLLDAPLSDSAKLRNRALYLINFFKKEEVLALYRKMVETNPQDASARYDLYQTLRQFNDPDKIFAALAEAVKLDPVYAVEYFDLADLALEKNNPLGALKMRRIASGFFPENTSLDIGIAELLIATGQPEKAKEILAELRKRPWSRVYHGNINERLNQMSEWAEKQMKSTRDLKGEKN